MEINARNVVVIPNWNGMSYLPNCLESLHRQSTQDFEIILVDNGSKDRSLSFVEENYPDVHIDALSRNVGFGCAANSGIKEVQKDSPNVEYIILLNNDTVVDKYFVENFVKRMDENKEFIYGAAKVLFLNPKGMINSCGYGYSTFGLDYLIGYGEVDRGQYNEEREVFGASAVAAIYRLEFFNEVGRFDEVFFAYSDDMDLNFRAQIMGHRCLYIPSAKVRHHNMGSVGYLGYSLYCFHKTKNNLLLILKHIPSSLILKYFPKIAYIQLKTMAAALKEGTLLSILRAYAFLLLLAPEKLLSKFKTSLRRRILISTFEDRMIDYHPYPRRHRFDSLRINFLIDTNTPSYITDSLIYYSRLLKMMGYYPSITYAYNITGQSKATYRFKHYLKKIRLSIASIWGTGGLISFGKMKGLSVRYIPAITNRYISNGDIIISTSVEVALAASKLSKEKGQVVEYVCEEGETKKTVEASLPSLNIPSSPTVKKRLQEAGLKTEAVLPLFLAIPAVDIKNKLYNNIPTILLPYSEYKEDAFLEGIGTIEILRNKNIDFNLVIFGSNIPKNIPSYAKFVKSDNKKKLGKIYWTANILFSPTSDYWFSQAIMEGMAFGCAIVSTKQKGEHFLADKKNAILAEAGRPDDMAKKLVELIENKDLFKSVATKGWRYVRKFSGDKMGENLGTTLKNIVFRK